VKVYGRDAWDGELLASAWRRVWYRGTQRTARLGRVECVEHEGLVTFLAQRSGAPGYRTSSLPGWVTTATP
jgi:hypothetical protein